MKKCILKVEETSERNILYYIIYNIHIIVNSKNNYLFSFIINTTKKCRSYVIIRNNIKKNTQNYKSLLCVCRYVYCKM